MANKFQVESGDLSWEGWADSRLHAIRKALNQPHTYLGRLVRTRSQSRGKNKGWGEWGFQDSEYLVDRVKK